MAIDDYYYTLLRQPTTQAVDDYGDNVTALGDAVEFMGCIASPTSSQAFFASQRGIDLTATLFAPVDAGIQPFDVITDVQSGATFQVVGAPNDTMRRGHHIEAALQHWRGAHAD